MAVGFEKPADSLFPEGGHDLYEAIENDSFWFKHRRSVILSLFEKYVTRRSAIADVGGGTGFIARALQENYSCTLIEPGQKACFLAEKGSVTNIF